MAKSYVYKWTDRLTNKMYIGVHKESNKHSGFGYVNGNYIGSQKLLLEQYKLRPDDFSREILQWFDDFKDAYEYETKLLIEVNARYNPCYYNTHNNIIGRYYNKGHTTETRLTMSQSRTGSQNGMFGRHHSEETIRKIREKAKNNKNRLGKKHTEESKQKNRLSNLGKKHNLKG